MWKFFIMFVFVSVSSHAQNISGVVRDINLQGTVANVILKKKNQPIAFQLARASGEFEFDDLVNIKLNDSLELYVTKNGYQPVSLDFVYTAERMHFDIDLIDPIVELKEMNVVAKRTSIKVRKDTVEFNAESFKDGSERVIEDLLKKLPGIQVEDDGKIKYKNKEISKFLLEGDDLFDKNYKIGSRNISIDIVDKIQALDNYNENYLLKGIENSDKVALNIVLKPGMADLSGDMHLGYGLTDRYDAKINAILLTKAHKNFSTGSYNNIGKNYTPFDFLLSNNLQSNKDDFLRFNSVIENQSSTLDIGRFRHRLNKITFANASHIYNINDNWAGRLIMNFMRDDLLFNKRSSTRYIIPDSLDINNHINELAHKKPFIFNPNLKFTWKNSKDQLLETDFSYFTQNVDTQNNLTANNAEDLSSIHQSDIQYWLGKINYTYKWDETKAYDLQVIGLNANSDTEFYLTPAINTAQDAYTTGNNQQTLDKSRVFYQVKNTLYGITKRERKYTVMLRSALQSNRFESSLYQPQNATFRNKISLKNWENEIEASSHIKFKNLIIEPSLGIIHNHIDYEQDVDSTFDKLIILPKLQLSFNFNRRSKIFMLSEYSSGLVPIENLFKDFVLIDFRNFERNDGKLFYQHQRNYALGYSYQNNNSTVQIMSNLFYHNFKNQFFSQRSIHENYTEVTRKYFSDNTNMIGGSLSAEKYFMPIESKIRLTTSLSKIELFNRINESEVQRTWGTSWNANLFVKSAFDIIFNFDNILNFKQVLFQSKNTPNIITNGWSNQFRTYWKINPKWFASTTWDWYMPDISLDSSHHFIDFGLDYQSLKNWGIRLDAKNLLGNKNFTTTSISEYYSTTRRQKLNERYIMLSVNFKF